MSIIHNLSTGITLNEKQQAFASMVVSGRSCCLVGAAGTGKTTAVRNAISNLLATKKIPKIITPTGNPNNPKLLADLEGIVGCAFTRRAVANLKANFPDSLHPHCLTIHALLEYQPVEYESFNEDGMPVKKLVFEPMRNKQNPLPPELKVIIFEESSMIGTELFNQVLDALPHEVQMVFLGDLNQLSPVFGDAILGFKLLELPTIQLTEVYRQALESPIIRLAHRVLSGKQILFPELDRENKESPWQIANKLSILHWKPKTSDQQAVVSSIAYLKKMYEDNLFDPYNDMVILPFNKSFGTINIGKGIANFMDKKNGIIPIEIISGFNKHYYAVGDLVLFKNEEYIITKIAKNMKYQGKLIPDTKYIHDRYGNSIGLQSAEASSRDEATFNKTPDEILNQILATVDDETTDEASHHIYLTRPQFVGEDNKVDKDYDTGFSISSRGQINNMTLAYATTCHKAQGLESKRVYIILHKSHGVLTNREWLYTAITRAREELIILCERDTFIGGINKQQIKGTTLAEKAEYFKGKVSARRTLAS